MKLIEMKSHKRFYTIRSGELFEYEGLVYLKTERTDSEGFPECFEVGTGEKLFLGKEERKNLRVTPILFMRE